MNGGWSEPTRKRSTEAGSRRNAGTGAEDQWNWNGHDARFYEDWSLIGYTREEKLTFTPLPQSSEMYVMWRLEYVQDVANSSKRDDPTGITAWVEESLNQNASENSLMNAHPFESMDCKIRMRIGGEAMGGIARRPEAG